jgi:hypothetical protein
VFPKNKHGGDQENHSGHHDYGNRYIYGTPNLTPKELVKFMDIAVARKYGNDLTNFTRTITKKVCNVLDTFKTDLQNMLPQQIRLVMQQVQGESQGKQPVAESSTPHPSSTSAPDNTGTLYLGNTTAPGNPGNIASTSTLHPGNTSGNVIYVNASSPYPGGVSLGNPGSFPIANLPYPGSASTSGNPGFPAHTTLTNPNMNFQQPCYQTMAYSPNIPPTGTGVPHSPIPDIFFARTLAYVTPNPRVEGEVNDGVRDQIARTLREFRFTPKGQARSYQKLYLEYFDMIPYPWGFWVLNLAKFTRDDAKTTYEHIGQFLAQVNDVGITDRHKIRMFPLSLTWEAFNWFTSLPPNSIDSSVSLEQKFHDYFYNGEVELRLSDLMSLRQKYTKTISDYLRWFRKVRNWCCNLTIVEKDLADLASAGLTSYLRNKLDRQEFFILTNSCSMRCLTRIMLSLANSGTTLTRTRRSTKCTSWRKRPMIRRAMRFV